MTTARSVERLQASGPVRPCIGLPAIGTLPGCHFQVAEKFAAVEPQVLAAEAQEGKPSGFDFVVDPVAGDLEPGADVVDGQELVIGRGCTSSVLEGRWVLGIGAGVSHL